MSALETWSLGKMRLIASRASPRGVGTPKNHVFSGRGGACLPVMTVLAAFALGCQGKPTVGGSSTPPPVQRAATAVLDAGLPIIQTVEYGENDFVESDRNRDPFRSYAQVFADQGKKVAISQRAVILGQYSIEELKLVAIQTGGEYARAMLIDPAKKGWVIKRGDFLGRPDIVHTGGSNGTDYQLNWRVDRVRDGDIVLVREDPAQPGIAPATRIIPLRKEGDKDRN